MENWKQIAVYFYVITLIVSGLLVACFLAWKIYDCRMTSAKARYTDVAVSDDEEEEIELGSRADDEADNSDEEEADKDTDESAERDVETS